MNRYFRKSFRGMTAALTVLLILQGCTTVGPDYQTPVIEAPDAWTETLTQQVAQGPQSSLQNWWTVFEDPVLDELIGRARKRNLDLRVAVSRVRESRAILAIARGENLPLVNVGATASRSRLSDDGPLQQVAPPGGFESQNLFGLGVDAAWEIDVFGRVQRTIEAAGDSYQASIEDYRDVLVTLFAEVALAYVDVRAAQQQIVYKQENIASQDKSLTLTRALYDSGVSSKLDVVQAAANLAATQATLPSLELSLNQSLNRLAVLLGQDAGSLQAEFEKTRSIPVPKTAIDIGVPADVLRQRPDIRRSERLLAAQTAQIGVATADLYPRFAIDGMLGLQSRSPSNLFDASSMTWGLALPVQWNLFSGGRVRGNIQVQDEKMQQLLLAYEHKVLTAIEEVENAIMAYDQNRVRVQHLRESTSASSEAVDLVLVQYNTGLTDFNNVVVTQRDLATRQNWLVATEAEVAVSLISLYKALGGGWDINDTSDFPGSGITPQETAQ